MVIMKSSRDVRCLSFLVSLFLFGPVICAEDVDLVLKNGNIYTVNDKQPHAEAIAVKGDRIVFVGSNEKVAKFHATRVVDLQEHSVVPGLTDLHCHIFVIGELEMNLNLECGNS